MISSKLKINPGAFGFSKEQWNAILVIFKKYPELEEVFLFGSRAKGSYKVGSDVDLAVKGKDFSISTLLGIQSDFEDSTLPYFFDILDIKTIASKELLQHIREYGIRIYEKLTPSMRTRLRSVD